jgi:hypothetical protein
VGQALGKISAALPGMGIFGDVGGLHLELDAGVAQQFLTARGGRG